MLVLSRRPQEQITFPTLGVTVQVVRVDGQVVRVGINAPASVPVLRSELVPEESRQAPASKGLSHRLRGQFNSATMALYVAQKQILTGMTEEANKTIQEALDFLAALERDLNGPPPAPAPRKNRNIRTLLVEDNAHERSLLGSYLTLSGMEVESVNDGLDALDFLANRGRPDVVLLDLQMPRCDGIATLNAIRSNTGLEGLKVFVVSGKAATETVLEGSTARADGWFQKPLNPAVLVETLTRVISAN